MVPWFYREDIERVLKIQDLLPVLETAFKDFSAGLGDSPVAVLRPSARSDVHLKAATLQGRDIFTVKVAGWSASLAQDTGNGSSGIIIAFDAVTCLPKAILEDRHFISDARTAATGALAARECARASITTVGVVGTGIQASLQVIALSSVRTFSQVLVWGRTPENVVRLCENLRAALPDVKVTAAASLAGLVEASDVVITATSSREPLIEADWLRPGMHITAVGADDELKCELRAAVFSSADRVIVDSVDLACRYGDIRRAIIEGSLARSDIDAELGEVLAGSFRGRESEEEVTVVKLVGLGIQDLAAVEHLLPLL
jgi:ornithine cyclodeaminase/alanine dehydrogenase-like protein (mu-crystallin family)